METETLVATTSAIIAFASAATTLWYSWRSTQHAERSTELAEQAARADYLKQVRDWADRTIEVITAVRRLVRDGADEASFNEALPRLRTDLSAQIEKGRWHFPNLLREHVGQTKEAAYRGLRPPILDYLVAIYDCLDGIEWANRASCRDTVAVMQRQFVSDVQMRLDPNHQEELYRQLLERYALLSRQTQQDSR